jgi:hypothetical protein
MAVRHHDARQLLNIPAPRRTELVAAGIREIPTEATFGSDGVS